MTFRERWGFSLDLFIAYLAIFHCWMILQPADRGAWELSPSVAITCAIWCVAMIAYWRAARRKGYFGHRNDSILHAIVILDIFLEGILPIAHDHFGFYLCAVAFALVIGPAHAHALRTPHPGSHAN
ncbi:MAG: hypothetical protein ACI8W8_004367 [Rhodothermales bacterium]|jgi:hypothetical protein